MTDLKPQYSISDEVISKIDEQTSSLAASLELVGLINFQLAGKSAEVYLSKIDLRRVIKVFFSSMARGILQAKIMVLHLFTKDYMSSSGNVKR